MPILSQRMKRDVRRAMRDRHGMRVRFMDVSGVITDGSDVFGSLASIRGARSYALQQGLNLGAPFVFDVVPHVCAWVVPLEDQSMVIGGAVGGLVLTDASDGCRDDARGALINKGLGPEMAVRLVARLPVVCWEDCQGMAVDLMDAFYAISGWKPRLMVENRQRIEQQTQLREALREQSGAGGDLLYAFEKERALLANIRADDRNGARRILNDMLTNVYLASSELVVLRARSIELLTGLMRAAVEDNPMLEPLIERTHMWIGKLISASSFEDLSADLMRALDEYVDEVHLHGVNRSNASVHAAIEFIAANYMNPLTLRQVAGHVQLSASRLAHLIKQYTGRTTIDIINGVRVRRAQELLERTSKSCADVAYDVGFNDQSYFTRQFRKYTGLTPARYRQRRGG